jgi:dTDP-glucose 4,6-dehydratase
MGELMRIMVTGGAGFIGSNFVHHMLKEHKNHELIVLDKLTYAGRIENLKGILDKIRFVKGDITNESDVAKVAKNVDAIINFAAETHVDRSISNSENFVRTNFFGTYLLLEYARKKDIARFLQISSDEVYGSIEKGSFQEENRLNPSNPYSASKAGADMLVQAYNRTYKLPTLITRTSNNFGPYQNPEKLIPLLILRALGNEPLPIYGDGLNMRDWIYVEDNCAAISMVLEKGEIGEIYNIGAGNEKTNLDVAKLILKQMGKHESLITFVKDRLGHDRRYSLNTSKIRMLTWKTKHNFEGALKKTIDWYLNNKWWWKPLLK